MPLTACVSLRDMACTGEDAELGDQEMPSSSCALRFHFGNVDNA